MNFGAGNTGAAWRMGLTPLRQTKQKLAEETNTLGGITHLLFMGMSKGVISIIKIKVTCHIN